MQALLIKKKPELHTHWKVAVLQTALAWQVGVLQGPLPAIALLLVHMQFYLLTSKKAPAWQVLRARQAPDWLR